MAMGSGGGNSGNRTITVEVQRDADGELSFVPISRAEQFVAALPQFAEEVRERIAQLPAAEGS